MDESLQETTNNRPSDCGAEERRLCQNVIRQEQEAVEDEASLSGRYLTLRARNIQKPNGSSEEEFETHCVNTRTKFKCSVCKKILSTKETLRKHILSRHIKLKPFICDICKKKFVFEKALIFHKEIHSEVPRYTCICSKTFKVKSSYLDHIHRLEKSSSSQSYVCSVCQKSFHDRQTLRIHLMSVHKPKTIKCSSASCNKVFSTISLMHAHFRCHSEKKYVCSKCGSSFKCESYLKKHKLTHSGIRPYSCQECTKTYLSVSHVNQHWRRAHSSATPFHCTFCESCFKTKEQMTYHENAHRGEKPFACSLCPYKTAYRGTLFTHTKNVHKRKKIKGEDNKARTTSGRKAQAVHKKCGFPGRPSLCKNKGKKIKSGGVDSVKNLDVDQDSFASYDIGETSTLNVGEAFLHMPVSMLWETEQYSGWKSPERTVLDKKSHCSESTFKERNKRMNTNVTLNFAALDNPGEKNDMPFSYDY